MSSPHGISFPHVPLTPAELVTIEQQTLITNYAAVASLAFLIRDIFDNVINDYNFIKSGLNIPLLAYFSSRIATIAFLLCSVVFSSIQSSHCTVFITLVTSFSLVAFSCTAILFFLRLRAVYNRNRVVVVTFFVLWLVFPALSIALPLLITIRQVYNSATYCPSGIFNDGIIFIMQLATLVYDTLVFIAISRRLCQLSSVKPSGPKENMRVILFGKHLPAFTKSLYRDGQVYYLTTLIAGIIAAAFAFIPGVPALLALLVVSPYAALVNIMACRVYRRTRMGIIREAEMSTSAMERNGTPIAHASKIKNGPITIYASVPKSSSHPEAMASTISTTQV